MKKTKRVFVSTLKTWTLPVIAICLLLISSCNKKEHTYTCDQSLNHWVIKNQARFEIFTRDSLIVIPSIDSQKAIYGALPAQNKYNVWVSKLNAVKERFILNSAEIQHIQKLIDFLKPDYYTSNQTLDQIVPWVDQWGQDGIQLGWDSTKLFLIAETWMMPDELQKIVDPINATPTPEGMAVGGSTGVAPNCNCRYSISCQWLVSKCSHECNGEVYECGLVGTSRCTGKCVSISSEANAGTMMNATQIDQKLHSYLKN